MVAMAPTMFKLGVSQVNPTILAIATQVMRTATFPISMSSTLAVATVANTVASCYFMAFLATPVTVSFDWAGAMLFNGTLSISDFALAKDGGVGGKVT